MVLFFLIFDKFSVFFVILCYNWMARFYFPILALSDISNTNACCRTPKLFDASKINAAQTTHTLTQRRKKYAMIETLNGTHETVNYKPDTHIRLYVNDECEHYPPHWHTDMEVLCPLQDSYCAICADTAYLLQPGDMLFIAPGTIHDLLASPSGIRIIFQISLSPLREISGLETVLSRLSPCCLITQENSPLIHDPLHHSLLEIKDLYLQSPLLMEASIYAKTLEMLSLLSHSRILSAEASKNKIDHSRSLAHNEAMQQICSYISQHCSEDLSLDQAASFAGFSKFYFERLFRDYTDMSFYQYLLSKRITLAEQLLMDPAISVTEVAFRSGFSSSAAFTKAFRKQKGSSPSAFRKLQSSDL